MSAPYYDQLATAVASVRRLHSKRSFDGDGYGWTVCAECRQAWPCATEQAIRTATEPAPQEGSG